MKKKEKRMKEKEKKYTMVFCYLFPFIICKLYLCTS